MCGLGDAPLASVIKYDDDPKKMWDAQAEWYAGVSTFKKASAQTELDKLRYGVQSMEKYVAEYEQLAAKLDAMNASMDESLLTTILLQLFSNHSV